MMKGQQKVEFIVSTFIFFIVLLMITNFLLDKINLTYSDSEGYAMSIKAENILNMLLKEKGIPENWEIRGNPERVGLAIAPYNLSSEKIRVLKDECKIIDKRITNNYKLEIINLTDGKYILKCGYSGGRKAVAERIAEIGDTPVKVILTLWW